MEVSIVIPVYNVSLYVGDCLRSVMRQTYGGQMSCLVVDDCSTDESMNIVEQMIAEYDGHIRFEILHHEHNLGLSAARNTGTAAATGEYILYIDSDDEITDDCVKKMMSVALENPAVDMVVGKFVTCDAGAQIPYPHEVKVTHACTNDEVRSCFYSHKQFPVTAWNKLIKRSFIQQNKLSFIEGILYEDTPWTFYLLKYITNAYFMSDVTYYHKIRPNSIVTGNCEATKAIHIFKGLHEIGTNLTQGYEKQELEFYGVRCFYIYIHHAYHLPELTDDLLLLGNKLWHYKKYELYLTFIVCYFLGRFKWGLTAYSVMRRIKKPWLVYYDIRQLFT